MKNVVFISNIKQVNQLMSSTDIMTNNIIIGLSKVDIKLSLIFLIDSKEDIDVLKKQYSKSSSQMFFLPRYFREGQSKYWFLFGSSYYLYFNQKYMSAIKPILNKLIDTDIIISNKVTIDEIVYGNIIKKSVPHSDYYQYWSDPMAISGILPEELNKNYKRRLFYFLEKSSMKKADRIIYGTRVLMDAQKEIFPYYANKTRYIDISYKELLIKNGKREKGTSYKIIYAGNYYSRIRNLYPLLQAVSNMEGVELDIYGNGDLSFDAKNINFKGRISPEKLEKIKESYDCEVCVLNHSCIQIPGKLFYEMYRKIPILVICDGPYESKIIDYIKKYKRFELCDNKEKSIKNRIKEIMNKNPEIDLEFLKSNFSNDRIASDLVLGGLIQ